MALMRCANGQGGGGTSAVTFTLENCGGCWYVISNGEVIYIHQGAWDDPTNFTDSDGYITITSTAQSYAYTVTFNKACKVTTLPNTGIPVTSDKTAGSTLACSAAGTGFLAVFE